MARVRGVVDPSSGSVTRRQDGTALLMIKLEPHRSDEGAIDPSPLLLWMPCESEEEEAAALARLRAAGAVLEATVESPPKIPTMEFRARMPNERLLVRFEPATDDELVAFAKKSAPAPQIDDAILGTLAFDARARSYTAARGDHRIVIYLDTATSLEPHLDDARKLVDLERRLPAIVKAAADRLYPLWDRTWRQRGETFTRRGFGTRLSVVSITRSCEMPSDQAAVWLDDGNLFGGHGIVVTVVAGEVTEASLAG